MSWLSQHTGIHLNLRPFAAPAGAVLGSLLLPGVGTALGAGLGAGVAKAGDNLLHGDSLQHALGQGALNGALAYGTAGLFHGGTPGGSAGGQVAADSERAVGGAIPYGTLGPNDVAPSAVQQNVLRRVLGSTGSFIKDNKDALETAGNAAGGILSANASNAQARAEQVRANAEAAQIQAAIDKQKAVAAAFGQLYARPLPTSAPAGQPAPSPSPVRDQVLSRVMGAAPSLAPQGGARFAVSGDGSDGRGSGTGDGSGNGGDGSGGQPTQGGMNPSAPKTPMPFGMLGVSSSPYAGNDSLFGSPYGYGYANVGRYFGGY